MATKKQVESSNVLVIGAGGIGCELLKNLALSGFKNITVIDLDTIDISNLNRQFLFRREHVGRPKAEIASLAIQQITPDLNIKYYHDSIMSEKFGLDFFKDFTFVMSALDNKAARSHVNRLCLVAEVPLIESGSAGYLGQVGVILRAKTECYDCVQKAAEKTFPSCTIRNTPTEMIHCVVWSKSVFNQLFGEADPDDDVSPDMSDDRGVPVLPSNNHSEDMTNGNVANDNLPQPSDENVQMPARISTRQFAEKISYNPKHLFDKLFNDDINYLLSMSHLWDDRKKPKPLAFDDIISGGMGSSEKFNVSDKWGIRKWTELFETSVKELSSRFNVMRKENKVLVWDKDDDPILHFVAACANIRAHIFFIQGKSLFDIKAMAGNIIPAIATTNACVAGMVLVEALKIVRGDFDKCRWVYINRKPNPRGKILMDEKPCPPNPSCYVCSDKREIILRVNLEKMEIGRLRDKVLIGALNMIQPDVMELHTNRIIISSDGETDDIMNRSLKSLGIQNGSQLECDDFMQKLTFKLVLIHSDKFIDDEFEIGSTSEKENKDVSDISDEGSSKLSTQLATSNINTAIEECPTKRARISCTET